MGFIRSALLFFVSSLLLILLIFGNFALSLSLSNANEENEVFFNWNNIFVFSVVISLFFIIIMFFLIENKSNLPINIGVIIFISSLPSLLIKFLFSYFENLLKPFSNTFSGSYTAFVIFFSVGIILIALGIGLKFMNVWNYLSGKLFKKEEKENQKFSSFPNKFREKEKIKFSKSPTQIQEKEKPKKNRNK